MSAVSGKAIAGIEGPRRRSLGCCAADRPLAPARASAKPGPGTLGGQAGGLDGKEVTVLREIQIQGRELPEMTRRLERIEALKQPAHLALEFMEGIPTLPPVRSTIHAAPPRRPRLFGDFTRLISRVYASPTRTRGVWWVELLSYCI